MKPHNRFNQLLVKSETIMRIFQIFTRICMKMYLRILKYCLCFFWNLKLVQRLPTIKLLPLQLNCWLQKKAIGTFAVLMLLRQYSYAVFFLGQTYTLAVTSVAALVTYTKLYQIVSFFASPETLTHPSVIIEDGVNYAVCISCITTWTHACGQPSRLITYLQ